jgi:hypothetical protein
VAVVVTAEGMEDASAAAVVEVSAGGCRFEVAAVVDVRDAAWANISAASTRSTTR